MPSPAPLPVPTPLRDKTEPGLRVGTAFSVFVPVVPPSMNTLVAPIWHQKRLVTPTPILTFKSQFQQYLPVWKPEPGALYQLEYLFFQDWYYKNGTLKRQDCDNLVKVCTDTIFRRYGLDDSYLWQWSAQKVQERERQGVEVTLSRCGVVQRPQESE